MLTFPPFLEELILSHLKKNYLRKVSETAKSSTFNQKDYEFFAKGAKALSDAFTEERGSLPPNYLNIPMFRSGYLLYFLPVNFLKIVHIMNELASSELVSGKVRVLDIGSGPGTSMLGLMHFFAEALKSNRIKEAWLEFTLLDQSFSVLKEALGFHQAYGGHLKKETAGFDSTCSVKNYDIRRGGLARFLRNCRYHLIVVSNVLNEIPKREERLLFLEELIRNHLEPEKGKLIIIEPALKGPSRELQYLRDQLVLDQKIATVYAPCLHQEVCPLNVINKRDWCHFYFSWRRPQFIEKVDRLIGNKKDWLACSYLVLGKKPREFEKIFARYPDSWRVISNRMPSNGKEEIVLCGPKGRYHAELLDKDTSDSNRYFHQIRRGDLVEINVGTSGGKYRADWNYRVQRDDVVKVLKKN